MLQQIRESGPPTTERNVFDFETRTGLRLPASYRKFLLTNNGGRPVPDTFKVLNWDASRTANVQTFYALGDRRSSAGDLLELYERFKHRIPVDLVPIGNTDSDDIICISCLRLTPGAVYLWDHVGEHHPPTYENIYKVADSFEEFLDGLHEYVDPDESEGERIARSNDLEALQALIASGLDLESIDKYGRTILENAAFYNRPDMIRLLFDCGASLRNALAVAEQNAEFNNEYRSTVDLLKSLSAKRMH